MQPLLSIQHAAPATHPRPRRANTYFGLIVYFGGFVLLLLFLLHYYLEPAVKAANGADPLRRHWVGAVSWLMMAVLLAYLIVGLIVTIRLGRFFFPRPGTPAKRARTEHVDIWAEAGKRLKVDEAEDPADQ